MAGTAPGTIGTHWLLARYDATGSPAHAPVDRFVTPDEFRYLERVAYTKGFLMVSASPLTRSSYHADADFAKMRDTRNAQLAAKKPAPANDNL